MQLGSDAPSQAALVAGAVLQGLGYAVGAAVFLWAAKGIRAEPPLTVYQRRAVLIAAVIGGTLGAKLTQWLAVGWPFTIPLAAISSPALGGRTIIGGIICGWIAVEIAKWRLGVRYSLGAPFALALAAGEAVGRWGCFVGGCCYGAVCQLPWAVHQHGALRHPAQLYSSLAAAGIFALLLWLRPRLSSAQLFHAYLVAYGLTRFLIEFARAHPDGAARYAGLSLAQLVALELALAGAAALALGYLKRRSVRAAPEPNAQSGVES